MSHQYDTPSEKQRADEPERRWAESKKDQTQGRREETEAKKAW